MRTMLPVFACFMLAILITFSAFSQNQPPRVSNVSATVDKPAHTLTVTYDLADPENDNMDVSMAISNDSGRTFLIKPAGLTGDVGFPVMAGMAKRITWIYDEATLIGAPASSWQVRIAADDRQPVDIQAIVDQVDSARLLRDLQFVQGPRNRSSSLPHLEEVKDTIDARYRMYGYRAERKAWQVGSYIAANLAARKAGLVDEESTYIVSAHFDTVAGAPGADDNGSGVVGMLEVARALAPYRFAKTVKLLGFDLEENGLIGSSRYVSTQIPSYEKIQGVFDYEMIGYSSNDSGSQGVPTGFCMLFPALCDSLARDKYRGNFLLNVANDHSNPIRQAYDDCARQYVRWYRVLSLAVPGTGLIAPDLRRSDHAPFWDAGYQALMLSDGANFRNLVYHTPADTLGRLSFTFMSGAVKATVATIATLAGVLHAGSDVSALFPFIPVGIADVPDVREYVLEQNHPNPFGGAASATTRIEFRIPARSDVSLRIYDPLGRDVATLMNATIEAGRYAVPFAANALPSGLYCCTMRAVLADRNSATPIIRTMKLLLQR
jgi:hypothetical protein